MDALYVFIIIPMTFLGGLNCQSPGRSDVETVLTSSGLQFIGMTLVDTIFNSSEMAIPVKSGEIKYSSQKTKLEAQLSNLSVHRVIIPPPKLSGDPSQGLKVGFSDVSFQVDFSWKNVFYMGSKNTLADSGRFEISAEETQVDLLVAFTEETTSVRCKANIENLSLLSGNMAMYYSISSSIRSGLEDEICAVAIKSLELSKITDIINIAASFKRVVNYPTLQTRYAFGSDFIKTYTNISRVSNSQAKPTDIPSDKMLGMSVSQNVIDETLKTLSWQTGFHPHPLKSWENISKTFNLGWKEKDGPYSIAFHFRNPPTSSISPDGISLNILGSATFESMLNSTSKSLHLAFNATLHLFVKLSLDGSKIEAQLKYINVSSVPEKAFNLNLVETWLETVLRDCMDVIFTDELPLVPGLFLRNPKMAFKNGYLTISSDLGWTTRG